MLRNVIKLIWRHVTLQTLSTEDLLIKKIKSKPFVLKKKLSVYSKTRVALLDPITEQH